MNRLNDDVDLYVLNLLKNIEEKKGLWYEIIEKLGKVENSIIVKHVKKYLESPYVETKREGINVLMRTYPDENYKLIISFLNDIESDVRFLSIYYLTRVKRFVDDASLIDLAINALRNDVSPDIRAEAAQALGYVNVNIQEVTNVLLWTKNNDKEFSSLGHSVSRIAENALKEISKRSQ